MKRVSIAMITVAGAVLLGSVATGLLLHVLLHLEWRIVGIVCLLTLAIASVAAVGSFQRVICPTQKSQMQRIAYVCSSLLFAILVYVGWSCGYPRTMGIIGAAVWAASFVYYHLGVRVPKPRPEQIGTSEEQPDASRHSEPTG